MKKSLADKIEQYLKVLIARSESNEIEIQRAELAETFNCAPSQVTYVISTRFSHKAEFYTESRRGGKGFVRISRRQVCNDRNLESLSDLLILIEHLENNISINEESGNIIKYIVMTSFDWMSSEQQNKVFVAVKKALLEYTIL